VAQATCRPAHPLAERHRARHRVRVWHRVGALPVAGASFPNALLVRTSPIRRSVNADAVFLPAQYVVATITRCGLSARCRQHRVHDGRTAKSGLILRSKPIVTGARRSGTGWCASSTSILWASGNPDALQRHLIVPGGGMAAALGATLHGVEKSHPRDVDRVSATRVRCRICSVAAPGGFSGTLADNLRRRLGPSAGGRHQGCGGSLVGRKTWKWVSPGWECTAMSPW
jgi:hypothetical protein